MDGERPGIDPAVAETLSQVRRRRQEQFNRLRRREWVVLAIFLVLAIGAYTNFQRVVVSGRSMQPTYQNGETLVMWKLAPRDRLRPGDVIVFRQGSEQLIKRIVYITPPGHAGQFPPPGFPMTFSNPEGWTIPAWAPPWSTFNLYFFKVRMGLAPPPPPANTIYVMGDNFPISDDSRHFGPISPSQVLGRVIQ